MTRHEIRKEIFQILFGHEFFATEDMAQQLDLFLQGRDIEDDEHPAVTISEENAEYIRTKVADIVAHVEEIDTLINDKVDGWKTNRMAKVDLTIIRLAVYEITVEKLPVGVAINEAVTLADEFGTDNSSSFVNGVLAKLVKTIDANE